MYQTDFLEENKTNILCSNMFFRKSYSIWGNVEKYCRNWQDTEENMVHAHCMLETKATHTFKIRNNYGFFKEQFAAKTRLIITLYAHICLVKFPYVINIPVWILPDDGGGRKQRVGGNKELYLYLCCMCRCLFIKEKYDKAQLDEWLTQR